MTSTLCPPPHPFALSLSKGRCAGGASTSSARTEVRGRTEARGANVGDEHAMPASPPVRPELVEGPLCR